MVNARRLLAFTFIAALLPAGCGEGAVPQGSYGTVIGTVSDASSGRAIAGAKVTVDGVLVVTTAADGTYRVPTVPVDSATTWTTVTVEAGGYVTKSDKVKVVQSQEVRLDFRLSRM
jgi:hypothetical protein